MTRRAVLHEDLRASHPHAGLQVLLQDHLVHGGAHLGIVLHKEEPPEFGVFINLTRKQCYNQGNKFI